MGSGLILKSGEMRYDEFAAEFPLVVAGWKSATRRSHKKRGKLSARAVADARSVAVSPLPVASGVAKPGNVHTSSVQGVAKSESVPAVGPQAVAFSSAEKDHPEFDIMDDGWARGFPGDGQLRTNRTAHAIRRFWERMCGGVHTGLDEARKSTDEFWSNHSGSAESRLAFFKVLDGRTRPDKLRELS